MAGPLVQAPIAVTGSPQVSLVAHAFASYVEIEEEGSGTFQGLQVTWPNGDVATYTPEQQPITIGSKEHIGRGPFVGVPANYNGGGGTATLYCQVESMGASTAVRISEWP